MSSLTAGIIKSNTPIIIGEKQEEVVDVFFEKGDLQRYPEVTQTDMGRSLTNVISIASEPRWTTWGVVGNHFVFRLIS